MTCTRGVCTLYGQLNTSQISSLTHWHRQEADISTDEQSWPIAAQCAGLWCLLCQVAGGGDTGDDARQGRVLAGSALLYNPLTNRVTHCCFGPGRAQTHCLASFKHETKEGQTEKQGGGRQKSEWFRYVRATHVSILCQCTGTHIGMPYVHIHGRSYTHRNIYQEFAQI